LGSYRYRAVRVNKARYRSENLRYIRKAIIELVKKL